MNKPKQRRLDVLLALITMVSAFLNGWNIWKDEYANTYYTTAVGSMLQSFSNFFFASLDSAGSVTVDKPPVTFWIQTAFAYVFGLHGWSVILPQALAGVGSVLLMYRLIKPTFGLAAARISALVMATTPVAVAIARTNNIDSMLVFTLLAGAALLFRGIRSNRPWSVIGGFAVVGIAFNEKMMQAYFVLPAFYLLYFVAFKTSLKKKISLLAGATALMVVISLSWATVVDLIPKENRPYIGSSTTNSVLELALGYNGVSRLTGQQNNNPGGDRVDQAEGTANRTDGAAAEGETDNGASAAADRSATAGNERPQGQPPGMDSAEGKGMTGGPGGTGSGGMFGTGQKGALRLFQSELSGQASWMIPLAGIGAAAILSSFRKRHFTNKHKETLFWLAWLIPGMVFFSIAGFFHQYYLVMLAPPIAGLAGAGGAELWNAYRGREGRMGWKGWLLPVAVLGTTVFEWYIVKPYDAEIGAGWSYSILIGGIAAALLLAVWRKGERRNAAFTAIAGLLVMLIGPVYWSTTPITVANFSSMTPVVGPNGGNGMGGGIKDGGMQPPGSADGLAEGDGGAPSGTDDGNREGGMGGPGKEGATLNEKLLAYLQEHSSSTKYLFAVSNYTAAAPYIVKANEKVVILHGFQESDPVYSTSKLEEMVRNGDVQYFYIGSERGGSSDLTAWIQQHGTVVPAEEYGGTGTLYQVSL